MAHKGVVIPDRKSNAIQRANLNKGAFREVGEEHSVEDCVLAALPSAHGFEGALVASTQNGANPRTGMPL